MGAGVPTPTRPQPSGPSASTLVTNPSSPLRPSDSDPLGSVDPYLCSTAPDAYLIVMRERVISSYQADGCVSSHRMSAAAMGLSLVARRQYRTDRFVPSARWNPFSTFNERSGRMATEQTSGRPGGAVGSEEGEELVSSAQEQISTKAFMVSMARVPTASNSSNA